MAIGGPKPRHFSLQNTVKDIFLAIIALKKKVGKMSNFGFKPWVNRFEKMPVFRLFELLVFITQKGVFLFQNIVKDIFLAYIASKKKVRKMAIFGPKPWVNPLKKMSILRLFKLYVFCNLERRFSVLAYRKRNFPGLHCL